MALALMLLLAPVTSARALPPSPSVTSAASVVIEVSSGFALFGSNAHMKLPMASTTKIMTALVAVENASLDDMVTVSPNAYGVEGSSMYLLLGETVSMRDLLYGLMIASGNDAAIAIAEHVGGSVEAFAEMMNDRAQELGLYNTHFVTPNGLHDEDHYTTAYDLAIITAAALEHDTIDEIVGSQYYTTQTGDHERVFRNKNKLLWNYDGADGVKTGYTIAAGKCLIFSATRGSMRVIGVTLRSSDIFYDARNMLDYAFENYENRVVVAKGKPVAWIDVEGGYKNQLALCSNEDIMLPVAKGSADGYAIRLNVDDVAAAPILAGDVLGTLTVYDELGRSKAVKLTAAATIERRSFFDYICNVLSKWG